MRRIKISEVKENEREDDASRILSRDESLSNNEVEL
jgi:hypothetical protein